MTGAVTGPGAADLLDAWERGLDRSPVRRALTLLAAAEPGVPAHEIARRPIGTRDTGLLRLRAQLFGDRVDAVGSCPSCGARLEADLDVRDLLAAGPATGAPSERTVGGRDVAIRPPTSLDLLAAEGEPDGPAARRMLLGRCLAPVPEHGAAPDPVPTDGLSEAEVAGLVADVAALDPLARIDLGLTCTECGHAWTTVFDVAGFLWSEVDAWARRTLRDVHTLARAYGWTEPEVLALGPRRRRCYLELVGA